MPWAVVAIVECVMLILAAELLFFDLFISVVFRH